MAREPLARIAFFPIRGTRTLKLLAIDTATEACSCALYLDGAYRESYTVAPRRHAEFILPMVSRLLSEGGVSLRQLDGLAFGRGPGAFTGVRIGAGIIQGLAFGSDLPVAPVSTLQALAQGACRELGTKQVLAAIDARMGEVYWGVYQATERDLMAAIFAECIRAPREVPVPDGSGWFGIGSGWATHGDRLRAIFTKALTGTASERYPRAVDVALLGVDMIQRGESVAAENALPIYLRNRIAVNKVRDRLQTQQVDGADTVVREQNQQ